MNIGPMWLKFLSSCPFCALFAGRSCLQSSGLLVALGPFSSFLEDDVFVGNVEKVQML